MSPERNSPSLDARLKWARKRLYQRQRKPQSGHAGESLGYATRQAENPARTDAEPAGAAVDTPERPAGVCNTSNT